jgi:branched-chain amino acid transport system substrate-binding protein
LTRLSENTRFSDLEKNASRNGREGNIEMNIVSKFVLSIAVLSATALMGTRMAFAEDQREGILLPSYRVGPFAPNGIGQSDAIIDYITLLNERDGGLNGTKLFVQECETQYDNERGVECYERYKNLNPVGLSGVLPLSAGIGYALYDRANTDKVPIITPGYGRLQGAVGSLFPYEFPIVGNDWEQTTAIMTYIANQRGGFDKLKGQKIALVYLDSAYGKEPFPVLDEMAKRYGIQWTGYPIAASAMVEQSSTWLQIRRNKPDYILLWGWGVMTPTAIKEAVNIKFPIERLIGNWWSAAEPDVTPVGDAAIGYVGTTFRLPGSDFGVYKDLEKYVYQPGKTKGSPEDRGTVLYNQGLMFAMLLTEGMRTAMKKYGDHPVSGEQTRWGLENVDLGESRLKQLGFDGMFAPLNLSCRDHAGGGKLRLIQWDGKKWNPISDWLSGVNDFSTPLVQASAASLAKEMGRAPRDCSSSD